MPSGAPGPKLEPHFFARTIWFFGDGARHDDGIFGLRRDGSPGSEAYGEVLPAAVQFNFFETAIFA